MPQLLGHLGIVLSTGSVSNIQKLDSELLAPAYEKIREVTVEPSHLNADETGWKNGRNKKWMWVAATPTTIFFKIDPSRSQEAFRRVFGDYRGALTTDRYSAYNVHKGDKQSCWAHLDRDFAKMAEREGTDGLIGRALQGEADALFRAWRKFVEGAYSREELCASVQEAVIPSVRAYLKAGVLLEGLQRKTRSTCYDLLRRFKSLWLFLYRKGVEPTNNRSERELRPTVIRRKISFGSRSKWGERFIERLLTVTGTLRQMSKNVYEYLTECFRARQRDGPLPTPC